MSKIYFLLAVTLLSYGEMVVQNNSNGLGIALALPTTDSSYLAVNKNAGW